MEKNFQKRLHLLESAYEKLIGRPNELVTETNGVFNRYKYPVLTAQHAPLIWRYDLNQATNPYLMERFGINAVFNGGAIKLDGKYYIVARVEGVDRKSFFAVAESDNGIDGFRFRDYPVLLPQSENMDTNVYDMRVVQHEDGWIYGVFCTERRDPNASAGDQSSAIAQCG